MRRTCSMHISWIVAGAIAACGGGGGGGGGSVKAPFKPVSKTSTLNYTVQRFAGGTAPVVIQREAQVTFHGGTWDDYQATYPVPEGEKKTHIYGELLGPTSITVAGYHVDYPDGAPNTDYTVTFDDPVTVDAGAIPVGVQQTQELSGEITFANNRPPIRGKVAATYTKTSNDATFDAEFGTVTGVQVFEGSATLVEGEGWDVLNAFKGQAVAGKVFFHPTLGVLKVEVPGWPIGAAMTGEHDCGNPAASDYNTIQKVGEVSTENPTFELSSYDCSGQFDADKMRHAQMLVELRWSDGEKAKTPDQPMVETTFATMWGWFPHTFLSSPTSIFHPEENGQGYTYWYAYVNEGAKNEPGEGNGIAYRVKVRFPDYMTSPVRVTARIRYPIYRP